MIIFRQTDDKIDAIHEVMCNSPYPEGQLQGVRKTRVVFPTNLEDVTTKKHLLSTK